MDHRRRYVHARCGEEYPYSDSSSESDYDSSTYSDTDSESDYDSSTNSDIDSESDYDSSTYSDTDSESDYDSSTYSDIDSETDHDASAYTDSQSDYDSTSETDGEDRYASYSNSYGPTDSDSYGLTSRDDSHDDGTMTPKMTEHGSTSYYTGSQSFYFDSNDTYTESECGQYCTHHNQYSGDSRPLTFTSTRTNGGERRRPATSTWRYDDEYSYPATTFEYSSTYLHSRFRPCHRSRTGSTSYSSTSKDSDRTPSVGGRKRSPGRRMSMHVSELFKKLRRI